MNDELFCLEELVSAYLLVVVIKITSSLSLVACTDRRNKHPPVCIQRVVANDMVAILKTEWVPIRLQATITV